MIKHDSVRITITMKKDQLKFLDETIKKVNQSSTLTYNRSSLLVTSFFALFSAMERERAEQNSNDKEEN